MSITAQCITSPWLNRDIGVWDALIRDKEPVFYKKKSFVFYQGDLPEHVYIVKTGRMRVTSFQLDGAEKQLYIMETGSICGEEFCIMGHNHYTAGVAVVDSLIYRISCDEVKKAMRENWELASQLMQSLCVKISVLTKHVLELSFWESIQRIAEMLLNLNERYGIACEKGSKINLRFTYKDVSGMVNASLVTVNTQFNYLLDNRIIEKKEGNYIILKKDALTELSMSGRKSVERLVNSV